MVLIGRSQFPTVRCTVMTTKPPDSAPAGPLRGPSERALDAGGSTRLCQFEIVAARPHPPVDMYKTLKRVLLGAAGARAFTRFQRRYGHFVAFTFVPGWALSVVTLFAPVHIGRWVAILAALCELPSVLMAIMSLRPDMIGVLMTTYDFWFFSTMSLVKTVVMSFYYHDVRAVLCVIIWVGTQFTICIDAAITGMESVSVALTASVGFNIAKLLLVALKLVPGTHSFQIFKYGTHAVRAEDVLTTTISAVLYLQLRTVYRKGILSRRKTSTPRQIYCASYRCTVKLRFLNHSSRRSLIHNVVEGSNRGRTSSDQMEHIRLNLAFDGRETVMGHPLSTRKWPVWLRILIKACGSLGLSLNISLFLYLNYVPEHSPIASVLVFVSLGCSAAFCSVCFALYHPQLLKSLCFSFDFFFLSFQLTTMHLTACDVFFWDSRSVVLITSLLWTHWVLTIDAFTPLARRKLGFRLWHCAPVVLKLLLGEGMLMYETASGSTWRLQDRKLLTVHAFGQSIDVMVMPLLFTRIWMMMIWECRVLWRIYHARETDLIIIHGVVAFNLGKHPPRRSQMPFTTTQIVPRDTSALSDREEAE